MPNPVATAFDAFRQRLFLPQKLAVVLRIQEAVTAALGRQITVIDSFLIGSCARGTACQLGHDVDIMVVLHYGRNCWLLPQDLLWQVRLVLNKELQEAEQVRVDGQAVTMRLYGTKVDVVPAFQTVDGNWIIPDTLTHDWILTNPRGHADLIAKTDQRFDGMFTEVVRMIKVWNHNQCGPLKGFHIELMAASILEERPRTYSEALSWFFAEAPHRLIQGTYDPFVSNQRVDLYLTDGQRLDALGSLRMAATKAQLALDAEIGRPFQAVGVWRTLLGSPFPEPRAAYWD